MYFWQLRKLKRKMVARPLSEREILPYLLGYLTLTAATVFLDYSSNVWDALWGISSSMLALIGTFSIYRQNGGANGQYFLQRYLAIGWVVTLRWSLIIIISTVILLIVLELANISTFSEETTWYEFLYGTAWEVIVYQRIGHHVRDVAQGSITA